MVSKLLVLSSVRPGKLICHRNFPPSKPVSASFVGTGKSISNKNVCLIKTVNASSVSPGNKPICGSNVSLNKHVRVISCQVDYVGHDPSQILTHNKFCKET